MAFWWPLVGVFFIELLAIVGLIWASLRRRKDATGICRKMLLRSYPIALRHPSLVYLLIGLMAFTTSAAVTIFNGIPQPYIQDEFSYLLAADTFAHGRITNPAHLFWQHFESPHVIQHPTYASKYPPAQGIALSLGQVVFGHPIVGVWLSVALACAAISWMIAGYCPLRWAFMGGLLAVIRLVFSGPLALLVINFGYWSQSYFGGAVAAFGGALVFGAVPRIRKGPRCRDALWLAAGLAVLANSRPYEGLIASVPVALILGYWMVKGIIARPILFSRVALPALAVLLFLGAMTGYYNFRVTGDPFNMPYLVYESTYGVASEFVWKPLRPEPHYHHALLRDLHLGWALGLYLKQHQSLSGWVPRVLNRIANLWFFYIGIILTPFMYFLLKRRRHWHVKLALVVWLLIISASFTTLCHYSHYAAPATALAFLLVIEGMRQARLFTWRGRPVGKSLVRAALPILLLSAITSFAVGHSEARWAKERARILSQLEQGSEHHLVMIRYLSDHSPHIHWGYNGAEIDSAKVVWATELDSQADKALLAYFKDRRVWLLLPDHNPPLLLPYFANVAEYDTHLTPSLVGGDAITGRQGDEEIRR